VRCLSVGHIQDEDDTRPASNEYHWSILPSR
jgi:hypothetical protein